MCSKTWIIFVAFFIVMADKPIQALGLLYQLSEMQTL